MSRKLNEIFDKLFDPLWDKIYVDYVRVSTRVSILVPNPIFDRTNFARSFFIFHPQNPIQIKINQ